jgi:hypothetical protein
MSSFDTAAEQTTLRTVVCQCADSLLSHQHRDDGERRGFGCTSRPDPSGQAIASHVVRPRGRWKNARDVDWDRIGADFVVEASIHALAHLQWRQVSKPLHSGRWGAIYQVIAVGAGMLGSLALRLPPRARAHTDSVAGEAYRA